MFSITIMRKLCKWTYLQSITMLMILSVSVKCSLTRYFICFPHGVISALAVQCLLLAIKHDNAFYRYVLAFTRERWRSWLNIRGLNWLYQHSSKAQSFLTFQSAFVAYTLTTRRTANQRPVSESCTLDACHPPEHPPVTRVCTWEPALEKTLPGN